LESDPKKIVADWLAKHPDFLTDPDYLPPYEVLVRFSEKLRKEISEL
jgi:hypothetical protein